MNLKKYLYFPETYKEGRRWFLDKSTEAGAEVQSFEMTNYRGPSGEVLATDVAWFGAQDAEKVFISISGTHGQEYFSGAAGQLQWIDNYIENGLDEKIAVCLVHCNNPYGSAYLSRANENFVDLNRNYLEDYSNLRANHLVPELNNIMFTKDMNEHVMDDVMAQLYKFIEENDYQDAITALGGGQNTYSNGNLYCGSEQQWSTKNLKALVNSKFKHAKKVALIDWHTGLGDYGNLSILTEFASGSFEEALAIKWWDIQGKAKDVQGDIKPDFIGEVSPGLAEDLRANGVLVVNSIAELGTVDNQSVLAALLIDRWLRQECKEPASEQAVRLKTQMLERLNPSCTSWRQKVLEHYSSTYQKTIDGLLDW